jgi:hypothetical protein
VNKSGDNGGAAFERQLRHALDARLASLPSEMPGSACLDSETLAAWADDQLDSRERVAAEAHAADCSRCQTLLAAMIRTMEPAADVRPWWRRPAMGWLVPLTAAATALVVWASVPHRLRLQQSDRVVPALHDTTGAPAATVDRLSASPSVPQTRRDEAKQSVASDTNQIPSAAAKALAPATTDAAARPGPSKSVAAVAPPQGTVEAPRSAAAPTSAQESFARALHQEAAIVDIVSVDPSTRWRIVPGGVVQRSTDRGSTWETQQTGVGVTLVAGASPSPSVCWLVGRGGIVLLQTDGRFWRRIAFPETADLTDVRASDEDSATVTTADGRTFRTTDRGLTWTVAPRG